MRRYLAAWVLTVVGCGDSPAPAAEADATTSTSTGATLGSVGDDQAFDDLPWGPLVDLPTQNKSCEDRGARFGIVAGPRFVDTQSVEAQISGIGVTAGAPGLFVTYTSVNTVRGGSDLFGVRIDTEGNAKGAPWALSVASSVSAAYGRDEGVLLTYCADQLAGWRAFDVSGSSLGPALLSPTYAACASAPPAAVWTDIGYLVAWHAAPSGGCVDGCLALAFGSESVVFRTDPLQPAFVVTDPLALAIASDAALIVASHVSEDSENELAMSLVDPGGAAIFPPLVQPFPSAHAGPQPNAPVAVASTSDDGFVVFVGGRGSSYGRLVLDEIASVEVGFEDVPLPAELADYDAFRDGLKATGRTGGLVLSGVATAPTGSGGTEGLVVAMLDESGDFQWRINQFKYIWSLEMWTLNTIFDGFHLFLWSN
ncbi:MAG: hypothetical protein AAF721_28335 [Myxococcota bacterium]